MPARGQVTGTCHLAVHDRTVAGDGPDRPVPAGSEQCDQTVKTIEVDDRIVSRAHWPQPTP